jgi:hypothetical protein
MGIEGIWIGYGIEVPYIELAKKLKTDITNLNRRKSIKKIKKYLNSNSIPLTGSSAGQGLKLCILQRSHSYDRSADSKNSERDSDNDSNNDSDNDSDDDDIPKHVYFGMFVQIGGYDCWNDSELKNSEKKQLIKLLNNCDFNDICLNMFGLNANLMTVVSGCTCCS